MINISKIKIEIIVIILLSSHISSAQTINNLDSFDVVLKKEKTDNVSIKRLISKMEILESDDFEAKEKMYKFIKEKCSNKDYLLQAMQLQARNYYTIGNYTDAISLFNEVMSAGDDNDYYETKCKALLGLGLSYYQIEQFPKSEELIYKSLTLAKKNNYTVGIGNAKLNVALVLSENDNKTGNDTFRIVVDMITESLNLWEKLKDTTRILTSYDKLVQHYADYKLFDSAILLIDKIKPYLGDSAINYGFHYFIVGKIIYQKAKSENNDKAGLELAILFFDKSQYYNLKYKNKKQEVWCYDWKSNCYKRLENHKEAYNNLYKYSVEYSEIINEENFRKITSLERNSELQKKDKEIEKANTRNRLLIISSIVLFAFIILGYRNFKHKQKVSSQQQELQKQKITELEKDKQLLAIDAMLQGQEEERSRIAKDLHDGLGGMLSGTKLSFINMKENLVLTPENATQFDKSLSMLDNTIADLRKVAHNLMPEALVKFGLQEAVRDFCNSIQSSTNLKVVYQPLGVQIKLSNTAEVFTYRIIQELVNNAVKHANASQIIVQLTTDNNKIGIAVEDDGKGFDVNALANSKGAGMDNIKYRVQYFNGTIDTVTSVGNGTSVNIILNT
jgi:signal transduction histidine kinase/tetratricopeptide (TPR) repeat protein